MSVNAAVNATSQTTRFAGFLAAALVLHGLFLMLPAQRGLQPEEVLHRLSVSLKAIAPPLPKANTEPVQPESRPAAAVARTDDALPEAGPATPAPFAAPPDPTEEAPAPNLSTARLLDLAHRKRWAFPEANEPRRLGEPTPDTVRRPPGAGVPTERPEMALGVEFMDRWLAADGSQSVLIRIPSGRVLCGRTEAWDPMRPLVEQVRMLRDCGSGEPTFEWPELYRAGTAQRP